MRIMPGKQAREPDMQIRDTQRSRVYAAERKVQHLGKKLPDVTDVERYIAHNMKRKAILRRYPGAADKTAVKDGRGTRNALAYGDYAIGIPLWARQEIVVLHEMAHIIAARTHGQYNIAAHGWQFCAIFLDLVRFCADREIHDALKASFDEHKVRYKAPRKCKPLSPEQRAVLVERLSVARANKETT